MNKSVNTRVQKTITHVKQERRFTIVTFALYAFVWALCFLVFAAGVPTLANMHDNFSLAAAFCLTVVGICASFWSGVSFAIHLYRHFNTN